MNWVGRNVPRLEDPVLVRGDGRFVADIAVGAQVVRFVRSPVASGRIKAITAPPGTLVITAEMLGDIRPIVPRLNRFNYAAIEQPVLPRDRVRYVGQAVAAVVGATPEAAEDLADAVELDIESDDPVVDVEAALTAAALHPQAHNNVVVDGQMRTPGCDTAFKSADCVVELAILSRRQNATPLEARGGHAAYDRATRRVVLSASTQMPHLLRTGIADTLGFPETDLQVIAPDVGGGFGQKMGLYPELIVLVWLARTRRGRFAWIEDRQENLIASAHSRDQRHKLRGAFDKDGTFRALDVDLLSNIGAFSCYPTTCGVEPLMAMAEYPGPYKLTEYGVRARGVATNTCPMAPYRGVSRPVISFAMERLMDRAARKLGIDPVDIRRRNLVDRFPHRTVTGLTLDEATYIEALDAAVALIDLPSFRKRQQAARAEGRYLGVGLAVINERTGYGSPAFAARGMEITPGYERVDIAMSPSGDVEARIGASPHGQGLRTSLSQIIADELGVDIGRIRVIHGDTDRTPYGWGTFASRSLVISGGASKLAAAQLADRLRLGAAALLQSTPDKIRLGGGRATVVETDASVSLDELARAVHHGPVPLTEALGRDLTAFAIYDPAGTFSNACHVAVVAVDAETGQVRIERYLVVEDAGRLINPMIVDGQVSGGVAQGIANALYEEIVYDEAGNILTATLADYLVPTMAEIPSIEIHHLATLTGASVTQAKGVGEGGAIGAPAAVVNAICDALAPFGIEIEELPASPERIRAHLRAKGQ